MSDVIIHKTIRDEQIFDLFKRRFDAEIDRAKNLDSKAGNIVGFVYIVVSLTRRTLLQRRNQLYLASIFRPSRRTIWLLTFLA
jgi:hypothetical protein